VTDNNNIPAPALRKLLALSSAAEFCSEKLIKTEQGITAARQRLTGGMKPTEYDDLRASLQQMVDDLPVLKRRCADAQSIYQKCREWVDTLPKSSVLEPVKIDVDGHDLTDVRAKLEAAQAELATLRALPTSADDIRLRVENYVRGMARPQITGIGKNERLRVIFPGAGYDTRGPREDRADPLALMALLFPAEMTAALMREAASDVVPIKERGSRIAALTTEIGQLAYVEEALIERATANGEHPERSPNASPQVVLQVRIA
jgi:hypothetical protein